MLLGLAGFLRYEGAGRYWLAGAFAALTAVKPHVLYLFWVALALHSLQPPRWRVLGGAVTALLAATAAATVFNPAVIGQYIQATVRNGPFWWHTPTLGGLLRSVFGAERHVLQYAPMVLGLSWLAVHWRGASGRWCWIEQMPLLVTVSVATAPYGWTFDHVVLLAMLLPAARKLAAVRAKMAASALAFAAVGVNLAALGLRKLWNNDAAYWWLAPAWLIWFLGFSRCVGTPIWAPDLDSKGEGKNTLERDAIRHGAD